MVDFSKGVVVELTDGFSLKRKFQITGSKNSAFRGISRTQDGRYMILNRSSSIQFTNDDGVVIDREWLSGKLRSPAKVLEVNGLYYVCNKEADEVISVNNKGLVENTYR